MKILCRDARPCVSTVVTILTNGLQIMEIIIAIGFILLITIILLGFWQLNRQQAEKWYEFETKISTNDQALEVLTQWLHEMRHSIDHQTATVHQQIEATHQVLSTRLDHANRIFSELNRELGQVQEIGRQIQKFQDIIQSPKLRGNVGEQILNDLLEQVLPHQNFKLQYRFKKGLVVDAIISTDKGIIPVDAKFPLSSFRRYMELKKSDHRKNLGLEFAANVKKYIDQVSEKYILPEEGTVDFALIYIPSEVVYYEILQQGDQISNYANHKNVLLVSPNSFYYFLKIILVALEGKRIEMAGQKILTVLNGLRQDNRRLTEQLRILTSHLTNAKNALDRVNLESQHLTSHLEDSRFLSIDPAEKEPRQPS